jgi:hypothetical protein
MITLFLSVVYCADGPHGWAHTEPPSHFLADEVLREVAGEAETRLQDRVMGTDIVAPMAERLLDTHRIHGMHAGRMQAEFFAGFEDQLQHRAGEFCRDLEFPAQFTRAFMSTRPTRARCPCISFRPS